MTIEDCLEALLDHSNVTDSFAIDKRDIVFLGSIRKQAAKKLGLTDRQHDVLKTKLSKYKEEFKKIGINIDENLDNLRHSLRHVDRTKHVKLVDVYEGIEGPWLEVKFPFNKKMINHMHKIRNIIPADHYIHGAGQSHFFKLSEKSVYHLMDSIKNKNYIIDPEINSYYENLLNLIEDSENYIPGIYDYQFKNCSAQCVDYAVKQIGQPKNENIVLYKDRQILYGLSYIDESHVSRNLSRYNQLSQKVVGRKHSKVFVNSNQWKFDMLIKTLDELERFPIVIVLPHSYSGTRYYSDILDALISTHKHFKNIIDSSEISVLYRPENKTQDARLFNEYVKTCNLNSPVTKNTKVVYIGGSKIPKPMLQSGYEPLSLINLQCEYNGAIEAYNNNFDLVLYYDTIVSAMFRVQSTTQFTKGIHVIR